MLARLTSILALLLLAAIAPQARAQAQSARTLVSADPMRDAPAGMQAWKIRYRTTLQDGRPLEVTGVVAAPRAALPRRPRRVIAWSAGRSSVETSAESGTSSPVDARTRKWARSSGRERWSASRRRRTS